MVILFSLSSPILYGDKMIRNEFKQKGLQEWVREVKPSSFQEEEPGSNPGSCSNITISVIPSNETEMMARLIETYHSYKPTADLVGRSINFWIKKNNEIIGMIGFGNSFMTIGCRDSLIGWKDEQKIKRLQSIANNWKYCLKPHPEKENITSQVMREVYKKLPALWEKKYKDKLVLLETLVEPPYKGNSYKSAGWLNLGESKGFEVKTISEKDLPLYPGAQVISKKVKFKNSKGEYEESNGNIRIGMQTDNKKLYFCKPLVRWWKEYLRGEEKIKKPKSITEEMIKKEMEKFGSLMTRKGVIKMLMKRQEREGKKDAN